MTKTIKLLLLCALLALTTVSAQAFPGATGSQEKSAAPASVPMAALQGTVVETMDSGGYTYLCVENAGQKNWAAIPATPVKVGDKVSVASGMIMRNFSSKSLGRTFEAIVFSQGIAKQ